MNDLGLWAPLAGIVSFARVACPVVDLLTNYRNDLNIEHRAASGKRRKTRAAVR
jgi:hypothetical protein